MSATDLIHVAASGELQCLFWGVVIAIFIISQIAKSRKKYSESAPKQEKPPTSEGDPAEELRKFLEGLGQAQKQTPTPAPPPAQAAAPRPAAPQRRVAAHRPKPRVVTPPPPPPPPVHEEPVHDAVAAAAVPEALPPDNAAVLAKYRAEKLAAAAAAPARPVGKWHAILVAELRSPDRHPVRRAFVLREILGAPTALRRREVVYPIV